MEYERLIRSAHRWLLLAVAALALATGALVWTKAWSQASSGTLQCSGELTQSSGMEWPKRSIAFTLDYAPGILTQLKSDLETLNAPLQIDLEAATLKATEPSPRIPESGSVLRISELNVSRQTGRFSLRAALTRESSDALVGTSVWEGTCAPSLEKDRKF
ncbi:MAG TPA: hypothetical protein VG873_05555 [Burkholderiales bacterium]|jgi:hypothetical protein|nr:hypothetical protein [Burkholderiales bacterium]